MTPAEAGDYAGKLLRSIHGPWRNTALDAVDWVVMMAFQVWAGDAPRGGHPIGGGAALDLTAFQAAFEAAYCPEMAARLADDRAHYRPVTYRATRR